jgi:hypothetical protein
MTQNVGNISQHLDDTKKYADTKNTTFCAKQSKDRTPLQRQYQRDRQWMHDFNRKDAELAYWLEKCLIYRVTRCLTT